MRTESSGVRINRDFAAGYPKLADSHLALANALHIPLTAEMRVTRTGIQSHMGFGGAVYVLQIAKWLRPFISRTVVDHWFDTNFNGLPINLEFLSPISKAGLLRPCLTLPPNINAKSPTAA